MTYAASLLIAALIAFQPSTADETTSPEGSYSQSSPEAPKVEPPKEAEKPVNDQGSAKADTKKEPKPSLGAMGTAERPGYCQAQEHCEEGTEFWPAFLGYRVKITDSILVVFTALLWWATRCLVSGADNTAKRQLRAYLGSKSADITVEFKDAIPLLTANIKLTNFGKTPAYNIYVREGISRTRQALKL